MTFESDEEARTWAAVYAASAGGVRSKLGANGIWDEDVGRAAAADARRAVLAIRAIRQTTAKRRASERARSST